MFVPRILQGAGDFFWRLSPLNASHDLHLMVVITIMHAMTYTVRLPDELGRRVKEERLALGLSKKVLAERAGKVREVVYRLEAGEDVTVSSLMAVLAAMGLAMRIERAGPPSMQEVAARFHRDEDDDS